jgi:hypothetical protein
VIRLALGLALALLAAATTGAPEPGVLWIWSGAVTGDSAAVVARVEPASAASAARLLLDESVWWISIIFGRNVFLWTTLGSI